MRLNKCQIASITISALLLIAAAVLLIGNYHIKLINKEIDKQLAIDLNSPEFEDWVDPPPPIYMQYWMFNLTNPVEFLKGEKADLSQIGPFTYQLHQPRYDVQFYSNDTVSYHFNHTLVFNSEMSCEDPANVNITTINVPLLLVANMIDTNIHWPKVRAFLKKFLEYFTKERMIVTYPANKLLFGYDDPIFRLAQLVPELGVPAEFGLFYGFNNTDDGVYLINSGKKDIKKVNEILKWNYDTHLNYWSDKYGNMINGSDGTFFHPRMTTDETVYTYSTDICRSLPLEYEEKSKISGVRAYRYHTTEMAFANTTVNPDNAAFCVPAGNCMGGGVLNISVCKQGAPIIISSPHFYLADEKYIHGVLGMNPSKNEHETFIDVEPSTGVVVSAQKRLQLNAQVMPSDILTPLKNFPETTLPLLWLNESVSIDKASAKHLKQVQALEGFVISIPFILIAISVILIIYLTVSLILARRKSHTILVNADDETES